MTNESVAIAGFGEPYRTDRDSRQTGKERGGGVCLYVREKFCDRANVTVKQRICTPELELISVTSTEIPSTRVRVYLRHCRLCRCLRFDLGCMCWESDRRRRPWPSADLSDAPCFIVGDFNHCDLRKALPSFRQFVTCLTRVKNTIDLCYGNIPRAYKSVSLPPVGKSDHNSIHLIPAYRPKIQTDPIVKKSVKVWTP